MGALAVGAAAAVATLVLMRSESEEVGGPLRSDSVPQGSGFPVDAHHALTYAGIGLRNAGSAPATLEQVTLVDPEPGVRLVGALAAEQPEGARIFAYHDFPPDRDQYAVRIVRYPELRPLAGFVVPPGPAGNRARATETQLYLGLESTEPSGRVTLESFRVHYRVGDRRYVLVVPQSVALCTPRAEYVDTKPCDTFLPGEG